MSERRPRALVPLGVALAALAYLLPFRSYGLNLDDEGVVLYSIQRAASGQLPYLDFSTGYAPGFYWLASVLWRAAGDLPTFRVFLMLTHVGAAAGMAWLGARVAGPLLAATVPLVYLAFIPVFPGFFCSFNVPYPAWLATLIWVGTACTLVAFMTDRRRAWLVLAGLGAAAAFATKPNAGVFALAAAGAVVLLATGPRARRAKVAQAIWYALWTGIVVGSWVTFGLWPGWRDALVYLVPLTAAMLALPLPARSQRARLVGDVVALLGSFTLATLPWIVYFGMRLGLERFLRDVLLLGSGAAQLYYSPYPPFQSWAMLVTIMTAGVVLAGRALWAGWLAPRHAGIAAVLVAALSAFVISRIGVMPQRFAWSLMREIESASFPLTLGTHAVGVVWLWRRRAAAGCDVPATLLLCALFMHLQLYPRADFMHLIDAIPLTAVFTAYLLQRVMEWWRAGLAAAGADGFARAVVPVTVAVLFACMAVRVSPSLAALWAPQFRLPFAVAPVGVEREHASTLEHLGAAAAHLATLVPEGGSSLAFPAADIVLFLSGTRNPTPYAYFFPGRPDHRDEAEIVDALVAAPPLALVSLNRAFTFFDAAPPYYFLLRRFARARYGLAERHGRFDVLALGGEARSPAAAPDHEDGDAVAALRGHPLHETASALLRLATDDDLAVRLNALDAIGDALEAEPSRGLETYVAAAGLDRAREVLLLRTIRDARDARTASYLFAAAARSDARIASEALGAMYVTRAELIARRSLWAGSDAPAVWPGRSELASAVRAVLADATAPPRATAFAADLAGVLGQHETVPALRARLSADAATAASAADALATLAPGGLACELTRMLERSDLDIVALVPTTLLRLGEQGEPMRREVGACLDDALARPGPGREAAIWIAAALADPRHAVTLRAALAAVEPGVRAAAAWALGELPPEVATTQALRAVAESDPDADVRRLAARAVVKQDGRSPRAGTPAPALGNVT